MLSSADWMDRNLFRRVETCFPIADAGMKKRIMGDLDLALRDNAGAWELHADGSWSRIRPQPGEDELSVQQSLLVSLAESVQG